MTKRVLIVDDNEDNRQILIDLLSANGFEVLEALNGPDAVAIAARETPDLVLMDIQLPGIDGHEATRRIKAIPALARTPVIAVTSYALPAMIARLPRPAATRTSRNRSARGRCWRRCAGSSSSVAPT